MFLNLESAQPEINTAAVAFLRLALGNKSLVSPYISVYNCMVLRTEPGIFVLSFSPNSFKYFLEF